MDALIQLTPAQPAMESLGLRMSMIRNLTIHPDGKHINGHYFPAMFGQKRRSAIGFASVTRWCHAAVSVYGWGRALR
jgi:hypothetical protein